MCKKLYYCLCGDKKIEIILKYVTVYLLSLSPQRLAHIEEPYKNLLTCNSPNSARLKII